MSNPTYALPTTYSTVADLPNRASLATRTSPEAVTADLQDQRAALLRLAGALGRAEARRLARPQRGAAIENLILILAAAALLAAGLASAIR